MFNTTLKQLFTRPKTNTYQDPEPDRVKVANQDLPAELDLWDKDVLVFDDGREDMPPKTRIIGRNVIFRNDITRCFNSIRGTILARRNVTLEDMCGVFSLSPPAEPAYPYAGGGIYAGGDVKVGTSSKVSTLYRNMHPATQIHGNIIAGGDVHIGDNVAVHGWIIAGGNVYIGDSCSFYKEVITAGRVYTHGTNVLFDNKPMYHTGANGKMVRTSKIIEQQPANARYFYNPGIIFKAPIFPKDYMYTPEP